MQPSPSRRQGRVAAHSLQQEAPGHRRGSSSLTSAQRLPCIQRVCTGTIIPWEKPLHGKPRQDLTLDRLGALQCRAVAMEAAFTLHPSQHQEPGMLHPSLERADPGCSSISPETGMYEILIRAFTAYCQAKFSQTGQTPRANVECLGSRTALPDNLHLSCASVSLLEKDIPAGRWDIPFLH